MSHFVVYVFGPDHENQLAPFHEFECTGIDDKYVVDVDVTQEYREGYDRRNGTEEDMSGVDWLESDGKKAWIQDTPRTNEHKFGYAEFDTAGDLVRVIRRTNPNKKWDWYVVGGRWSSSLRLKPNADGKLGDRSWTNKSDPSKHGYCDVARLGDIDLDAERDVAAREGEKYHDRWTTIIAGHPRPRSWTEIREEHPEDIDKAREIYRTQPAICASQRPEHRDFIPFSACAVEYFGFDRAAFVERCRQKVMVPYAFVHEGRWYGKGEMGWFGCSHDEKGTDEDWNRFFSDYIAKLDPDTLVTVVDCHI